MNLKLFLKSMKIFNFIDKMKIICVSIIQIILNFLDLLGVLLIGLIGALAINGTSSRTPGDRVQKVLTYLNLENSKLQVQVATLAILASFLLIVKTFLSVYFTRKILIFLNTKSALLTKALINRIFSRSIIELNEKSRQENLSIMSGGVASVVNGVIYNFISLFTDSVLLLILLIGLFIAEPIISIAALVFFGGTAYLLYLILKHRNLRLNNERFFITAQNNGLIIEFMNGFRESVVANRKNYYLNRIGSLQNKLAINTAEVSFLPNISKYILEVAIVLGSILIAAIQFSHSSAPRAIAVLAIFLASSTRMVPAILRIQQSALQIRGSKDVAELTLNELGSMKISEMAIDLPAKFNDQHESYFPKIVVKDLSFTYGNTSKSLFENMNLEIDFGSVVAIVGPSGSGKSTLVDLMLGLLQPQNGSVLYNSQSPANAISNHPGAIAYVPQEIQIINGTLRDNLIFGYEQSEISENQCFEALEIAQLDEFVRKLPDGLDSLMGEMGSKLSGGQKQRIGIARALITKPRVIFLDEATSALDTETELALKMALMKLRKSTTIIIIAHRLSTVIDSDLIIYLENGKLRSMGTLDLVASEVPSFAKNIEKLIRN